MLLCICSKCVCFCERYLAALSLSVLLLLLFISVTMSVCKAVLWHVGSWRWQLALALANARILYTKRRLIGMGVDLCQDCLHGWMKIMHVHIIVLFENNSRDSGTWNYACNSSYA